MNIVTTTCVFPPHYAQEIVLERLHKVGFTTLDMGFDYCIQKGGLLDGDNWQEKAEALRQKADALGVRYTHAHACYYAASRDESQMRCFWAAAMLGAKYLVVHPVHEKDGHIIEEADTFVRINREAIMPLLPLAQKYGLILLSENILWGASSQPQNIVKLVQAVNSPYFGWCYDTGHSHSCGVPVSVLRNLEVVPLSLHIQDTHGPGSGDEHLLPGDGNIDWKEFLQILREIGYQGELVLEAHHQSYYAPDEKKDEILTELFKRAGKMREFYTTNCIANKTDVI